MPTVTPTAPKKSDPAAPPKAQRADARRNREAVIEAARARFAEDGMAAQMDDIARDAKVGVGTVYRHFPTKEDLIDALVEARFATIAQHGEEALESIALGTAEPWDAFSDYMFRCVDIQAKDRALSQVMGNHPTLMGHHAEASGAWSHIEELVALTKKAGEMRKDARPEDIPMLICSFGVVTEHCRQGQGALTDWKRFLAISLDGLHARGVKQKLS
jgi:AcrR family transcriptional regulator